MSYQFILVSQLDGIASVTLNRPEKRNALHGPFMTELLEILTKLSNDDEIRVLMINGNGETFCAGGDLAWMQKITAGAADENDADAQLLADLLYQLYCFPKPTIVLAHGMTLGGGLGLLAACDITLAAKSARFCFPEVKIGLAPSVISPYVIAAIGERAAHYYFLSAEPFSADIAHRLGLIQAITEDDTLMSEGMTLARNLLQNSPSALRAAKQLIRYVAQEKITETLAQKTAEHLANLRATPEGQEGLRAFLEKRKPRWNVNKEETHK